MTTVALEIHGSVAPGFERVRDAFAANFEKGKEVGASFAATLDGEPVVDLWAGEADEARSQPWRRDTIVNVFSTTKAMAALCVHMCVDRGLIDLDAPVARYWPEFAQGGKEAVPVRIAMSHQAGVPGVSTPLALEDTYNWEKYTGAIAAEAPWWTPGTENGYHAITYGQIAGELVRRVTGKTPGTFFREEVALPINADFHIGFGPAVDARVGEMISAPAPVGAGLPADSLMGRVMLNPPFDPRSANTRAWRGAEIPAANGHGNARSCARVMSLLAGGGEVDGIRLLSAGAIQRATEEQCYRLDKVLSVPMRWGVGFMLGSKDLPISPTGAAFGHGGAGGSLAIADPPAKLGWAYVMNRMEATTTGDARGSSVARELYAAL
jgi:CubicO group peptidase (beta-lactamase class C family)